MRSTVALLALLAVFLALPAEAQIQVNPNMGATLVLKDGKTTKIGEVLADISYSFPFSAEEDGRLWGELVGLYGIGVEGNQLGGIGFRTYIQQGTVYPGFGLQAFVVDGGSVPEITETSITLAPEILLEIPWVSEYLSENGEVVVEESMVAGYAALYFPVSGDEDFTMVRFGLRAGL